MKAVGQSQTEKHIGVTSWTDTGGLMVGLGSMTEEGLEKCDEGRVGDNSGSLSEEGVEPAVGGLVLGCDR
jgi:hypothetical protein